MAKFKKGQTVYILGRYRATVIECGPLTVTCEVYEGLGPHEKTPPRANYGLPLVEAKQAKEESTRATK